MKKQRSYTQLQPEERVVIAGMTRLGASVRTMAHTLERSPSTIGRKLDPHSVFWGVVRTLLDWKWSPQQIACLRHGRSTRRPRTGGTDRRGRIPDMISIHVRPPQINDRLMPGHWEGDLIKGAGNASAVGVLVERTSRLVLLARMDDASAASALAGFTAKLNAIAAPMRHSLTYDQGREMTRHADLTAQTGVTVYFCDPHSPWQRGTCENTNGLIRHYLPKGTDLSVHTQADLDAIADSLNTRPRATHDWQTPLQVFAQALANAHQASISVH